MWSVKEARDAAAEEEESQGRGRDLVASDLGVSPVESPIEVGPDVAEGSLKQPKKVFSSQCVNYYALLLETFKEKFLSVCCKT